MQFLNLGMFISFILSITGRTPPTFRDVFMLYCGLSPGATVRDLCTRYNPASLRVDERYCGKKSGVIIHRVLISTVDLCSFNFFAAFVMEFIRIWQIPFVFLTNFRLILEFIFTCRRLIQFGMLTGIIRRLHKYPVQLTAPSKSTSLPRSHHRLRGKHSDSNRFKLSDKWVLLCT